MAAWKTTFVSQHLNTDQSQVNKCFALVHVLPVAVLAIPASNIIIIIAVVYFRLVRGPYRRDHRHKRTKNGTALPRKTMQRAQNTVDYLSHVFFLTCTHVH